MDVESINRWEDYSRVKDEMMIHTDTPSSRWFVVESDIKKHARLTMIAHLLSSIPYTEAPSPDVKLPKRLTSTSNYQRPPREQFTYVPDYVATLLGDRVGT
jgi:polyphosphate kinase